MRFNRSRDYQQINTVKGEIIEITIAGKGSNDVAARQPITLKVERIGKRWFINAVTLGAYGELNSVVYRNTQYGFSFKLPDSWKSYMIVMEKWESATVGGQQNAETVETGPVINIRHPFWTSQNPRQDIPIMVFTLNQWDLLKQGKLHIGAAPIGPSEISRNSKYVFALPARYNYAFPAGYEEVEKILESNPLQANG